MDRAGWAWMSHMPTKGACAETGHTGLANASEEGEAIPYAPFTLTDTQAHTNIDKHTSTTYIHAHLHTHMQVHTQIYTCTHTNMHIHRYIYTQRNSDRPH